MEDTKVIIADANQIIRTGLQTILSACDGIEVLGEAGSPDEVVSKVHDKQPDILLLDYTSAGFSIDLIPALRSRFPFLKIVAITGEQSGMTFINALKAGVTSYIKKDCDVQEIIDAVKQTGLGGKFFCGQIIDTIKRESIDLEGLNMPDTGCEAVVVSERELEVIKLIAEGYTNAQIAQMLFLSNHTIATHRKNIMQKLGVNNTAAIVMYAVKSHLVSPNKFLFSPVSE